MNTKTENIHDRIKVEKYGNSKCPRCWHRHFSDLNFGHEEYSNDNKEEKLCNKCMCIIMKYHINHKSVPYILENLKNRNIKIEDNPEWENI